ncbi:hypothetical protein D3C71_1179880 [compost metagenome]
MQADVAPHGRVGRRQTGEIAETGSGIFDHFRFRYRFQIVGRADNIVGNDMRKMRHDRQHLVMVLRIHVVHPRAERHPEGFQPVQCVSIGIRQRREDAPAITKQTGKTGIRA